MLGGDILGDADWVANWWCASAASETYAAEVLRSLPRRCSSGASFEAAYSLTLESVW